VVDFKISTRKHPNTTRYSKDEHTVAKQFADRVKKELGEFLKSVILFGSSARAEKAHRTRDIDVLMIIDDLTMILSPEVVEAYRVITENVARKTSRRLHINTLKLTSFWDYVRHADPVAVNMLRDGIPLIDVGVFEPVQMLLFQGKIKPTRESIYTYYTRAPATLKNSEWHILQACLDLYWAVIDAAHAALMKVGEVPTAPKNVARLIESKLVKKKLAPKRCTKTMDFFYELSKKITHREIAKIPGKKYDEYRKEAEEFIRHMKHVIEKR